MPIVDIREFTPSANAHVTSTARSSHTVSRGTLPSVPGKVWIRKEMTDPAVARSEEN